MHSDDIQNRLNALSTAMTSRGLVKPEARVTFNALAEPYIITDHEQAGRKTFKMYHADTLDEALDQADAFIAALPSKDEQIKRQFLDQLAATIEYGRANGIDVEFVNPLMVSMKKLSANAIGWTPPVSLPDDIPF